MNLRKFWNSLEFEYEDWRLENIRYILALALLILFAILIYVLKPISSFAKSYIPLVLFCSIYIPIAFVIVWGFYIVGKKVRLLGNIKRTCISLSNTRNLIKLYGDVLGLSNQGTIAFFVGFSVKEMLNEASSLTEFVNIGIPREAYSLDFDVLWERGKGDREKALKLISEYQEKYSSDRIRLLSFFTEYEKLFDKRIRMRKMPAVPEIFD